MEELETLCEECHSEREWFNKEILPLFKTNTSARMVPFARAMQQFMAALPSEPMSPLWTKAMLDRIKEAGK